MIRRGVFEMPRDDSTRPVHWATGNIRGGYLYDIRSFVYNPVTGQTTERTFAYNSPNDQTYEQDIPLPPLI
jgi:hypothetical protein